MAANVNPIFELTPQAGAQTFVNADATNKKTLITAGAAGFRLDAISICSNDISAVNLAFYIDIGGTDYYIGNVLVAIGSGYTTVLKVDGLIQLKPAFLNCIVLPAGALLECNSVAAVAAAKTVTVVALGGDF